MSYDGAHYIGSMGRGGSKMYFMILFVFGKYEQRTCVFHCACLHTHCLGQA